MSDPLRSLLLGHQRHAEDLPPFLRRATRALPRRRPDRRRVRGDLPAGGIPDARGADFLAAAARGALHHDAPLRRADVLGSVPALADVAVRRAGGRALGMLRARHDADWRDPAAIASQWREAGDT